MFASLSTSRQASCPMPKLSVHLQVLKLLDAAQGTVAAGDMTPLNFLFSPLEARVYTFTLPIKLSNGTKTALHITGQGYHPLPAATLSPSDHSSSVGDESQMGQQSLTWGSQISPEGDKATWPGFSTSSLVQFPQQLLSLSHTSVSFGPVSIQGISKRVVAVTAGPNFGVEFAWDLSVLASDQQALDGCLQIDPMSGKLGPNDCCLCRLIFIAGLNPQLLEASIKCHITPVTEPLSPLQPARVPSINSPLHSPRTAAGSSSQAESPQKNHGENSKLSTAQHGRRSPKLATSGSPKKSAGAAPGHEAGAPVRQGSLGSPKQAKGFSSPSHAAASQNRAPVSRSSSSVSSPSGQKGMAPLLKSPPKASSRTSKAASSSKAGAKASSTASLGRVSSVSSKGKPTAQSPHKARMESGRWTGQQCTSAIALHSLPLLCCRHFILI